MQLSIHRIILWPNRSSLGARVIPFESDQLNVLTGQSGTGKSSLISIVDYALGSGKCAIPVGLIRENTGWFGVMLRLNRGYLTIARKNPGEDTQSGDAMLRESSGDQIPIEPKRNLHIREVVDYLDRLAGLPTVDFKGGAGESNFDARPSFRDMAAFNFQPQHIVANPYTLFFKADTEDHRRKLANVLPFVLGATNADQLVAKRRLQDLDREIRRLRDEYDVRQSSVATLFGELRAYFFRGKELGVIGQGVSPGPNWQVDQYATAIAESVRAARDGQTLVPEVGGTDSAVTQLVRLTTQEDGIARDLSRHRAKLARLETIARTATDYGGDLIAKGRRLDGLGWFKEKVASKHGCPFCGSEDDAARAEVAMLEAVAEEARRVSARLESAPVVLDREREDTRESIRQLERDLIAVRQQGSLLQDISERVAERRQTLAQTYRFLGSVEQLLATYQAADKGGDLASRLAELEREQGRLRRLLDAQGQRERSQSALSKISESMRHYARLLQLERADERATISVSNLAVKVGAEGDREDFLWEIGSGENWVGYHLAALLSLHEFFLSRDSSPVPRFLMIDQPSQVYFPESWPGDPTKTGIDTSGVREPRREDKDIVGVRRIFAALASAVERTNGKLQLIVTDHAGEIAWEGLPVNVVAEWRTGRGDFLIPENWRHG